MLHPTPMPRATEKNNPVRPGGHCILLVSHQEEFADAFPDGYRFELQNGATKVSRFER